MCNCTELLLLLHPFNGLFSRTTWVNRYQKCTTSLDINEARDDGVSGCSGISLTIHRQSAPCSRQITTPATHHSVFYRPDALPATQPVASKHWRQMQVATEIKYETKTWLSPQSFCSVGPCPTMSNHRKKTEYIIYMSRCPLLAGGTADSSSDPEHGTSWWVSERRSWWYSQFTRWASNLTCKIYICWFVP